MPETKAKSFFGLRSGERFRLHAVYQQMNPAHQILSSKITGVECSSIDVDKSIKHAVSDIKVVQVNHELQFKFNDPSKQKNC